MILSTRIWKFALDFGPFLQGFNQSPGCAIFHEIHSNLNVVLRVAQLWSCQDHVPEVKVLTTLGMFAVPVTAETTLGEIRQKVQDRKGRNERNMWQGKACFLHAVWMSRH